MQFWSSEPTILLNKDYIFELWPTDSMCYEQKLNAISRLIVLLSILGFLVTGNIRILVVGVVTMGIVYFMWSRNMGKNGKEGFKEKDSENIAMVNAPDLTTDPTTLDTYLKENFYTTNKKNPLGNVLLTEIMDNPDRKSAPPAFNPDVQEDITRATKKTVQFLNPGIKNTNKQLFSSLTDNFYLDQSNRAFFSNPSTKIPNDQGAFADFLYGDMPSCKDGDGIQCIKDNYRYTLY
jgi:hypothetical protein